MKRLIITFALILALALHSGQAFAFNQEASPLEMEHGSEIELVLIQRITPTLSVSGTTASFGLSVTCISSVNNIQAIFQIQQWSGGKWSNFGSPWTATSSTWWLSTSSTRPVAGGMHSYRLMVTITASNGSASSTVTAYSG